MLRIELETVVWEGIAYSSGKYQTLLALDATGYSAWDDNTAK